MKNLKLLCTLVFLAGISIAGTALADHGYGHGYGRGYEHEEEDDDDEGGFGIGFDFGEPYPDPYDAPQYSPYYPPVVMTPPQPPVYIEQQSPAAPQAGSYWYHCDKPEGYYPYVRKCPGGWQKVAATPPGQ
jgi:hypothetical protein